MHPKYGSLHRYEGQNIVILGNTVQKNGDAPPWIWAADWDSGIRVNANLEGLSPPLSQTGKCMRNQPRLTTVVTRVMGWAENGNGDAMWWLGDFFEFGSRDIPADGGRALAYYLGAIHADLEGYSRGVIRRVLVDGATLFIADCAAGDTTTSDVTSFLLQFEEFRDIEEGIVYYPDPKTKDWQKCIAIANKAAEAALDHPYWSRSDR